MVKLIFRVRKLVIWVQIKKSIQEPKQELHFGADCNLLSQALNYMQPRFETCCCYEKENVNIVYECNLF